MKKKVLIFGKSALPLWLLVLALVTAGAGAAAGTVLSGKVTGEVPVAVSQALLCEKPIWLMGLGGYTYQPQQVYMHAPWVAGPNRSFAASADDNTGFTAAAEVAVGDWVAFDVPLKNASNVELVGQMVLNVPECMEVEVFQATGPGSHVTDVVRTGFNTWFFKLAAGAEYHDSVDSITILISVDDNCAPGFYTINGSIKQIGI